MARMVVTARELRFQGKTLLQGTEFDCDSTKEAKLLKAVRKADFVPDKPADAPPPDTAREAAAATSTAEAQSTPTAESGKADQGQPAQDTAADTPRARRRRAMQPAFQPDGTSAGSAEQPGEGEDASWQDKTEGDGVPAGAMTTQNSDALLADGTTGKTNP